jgi:hypothetical protein
MVSKEVLSSHAIWITAEISPAERLERGRWFFEAMG